MAEASVIGKVNRFKYAHAIAFWCLLNWPVQFYNLMSMHACVTVSKNICKLSIASLFKLFTFTCMQVCVPLRMHYL